MEVEVGKSQGEGGRKGARARRLALRFSPPTAKRGRRRMKGPFSGLQPPLIELREPCHQVGAGGLQPGGHRGRGLRVGELLPG